MNFISKLFSNSNDLTVSNDNNGLLKQPGDKVEARITDSNRKVFKVSTDKGNNKYSRTQYLNGTIVETKTTKNK